MSDRYLCIHGHFYQPPRENPWLGFIETQASARPFHDWNERITRECYAANARTRIMGRGDRIAGLINNYEYMSFNFGPTLLSWLERRRPWVYEQILSGDRASRALNQGHGNALAQVYNHIIMPLADSRDKLTQIRWGLSDFKVRFGREADGMWLSETAVDTETLKLMAGEGLKFTILSPGQAREVRPIQSSGADGVWQDVSGGRIDPRQPYRVFFDREGRRHIDVFFYDGPISRAVAYEKLLASGAGFLSRTEQAFGKDNHRPRLVNLATDGESYGHHFKFGEMALGWVFDQLRNGGATKIINYAAFLDLFPPDHEVRIVEGSSWSCAHGVERWRSDCGCSVGRKEGWDQAWRAPLREGLDWLAGELAAVFESRADGLLEDPWAARDDYISVLLSPDGQTREDFLSRHTARALNREDRIMSFRLLESQVFSMFMFTSCGWFFDDIAGLEAVQNLKYAARAIDLVQPLHRTDLTAGLLSFLTRARSNDPDFSDGAEVYRRMVAPSKMNASRAAAHFALCWAAGEKEIEDCPVARTVRPLRQRRFTAPALTVVVGEVEAADERTGLAESRAYLAQGRGGARLSCLVGPAPGPDLEGFTDEIHLFLEELAPDRIEESFLRSVPEAVRYGLEDLIPDSKNVLARHLARESFGQFKAWAREYFEFNREVLSLLQENEAEGPGIAGFLYQLVVCDRLTELLEATRDDSDLDLAAVRDLADQAKAWNVTLNDLTVIDLAQAFIHSRLRRLVELPDGEAAGRLIDFLHLSRDLNLDLDLWEAQNDFYDQFIRSDYMEHLSPDLRAAFEDLGRELGFDRL